MSKYMIECSNNVKKYLEDLADNQDGILDTHK